MKITVVTVCYNAVETLEETMLSVLNQTYPDIEYIIIDGGSTDGTVDIIKKYADRLANWISEPDKGIYDAMNKGIALATGDWIIFMNAGDSFVNQNVLKEISVVFRSEVDVVYGDNFMIYKSQRIHHRAQFFSSKDINMPFNHQSTFVKTIYAKQYPFNLKYRIAGDYNFFFNLYKLGRKFRYVSLPVANYTMDGISQKNVIKTFKEIKEIQNKEKNVNYYIGLSYLRIKLLLAKILPNKLKNLYRSYFKLIYTKYDGSI